MEVSQQNEDAVKITKKADEATANENNIVSQVKKACSPSPPMVLIQTVDEQQQQQQQQQQHEKPVATNNNIKATTPMASITSQQLALIEAADSTELELVMRMITERFPSVKINFFQKSNKDDKSSKQLDKSNSNNLTTENGNSVTRRLSTSSIRATTSVDGSGLLHMMAIERQESRDSGFWSVSKCSFESMKSLSLTDSHSTPSASSNNSGNAQVKQHQANEKSSSPAESNSNSKSSSCSVKSPNSEVNEEIEKATTSKMEDTSMELTNLNQANETSSTTMNDENKSDNLQSSTMREAASNEGMIQRAESAGSKPTMYNWKKWKKGQAWRYTSSSSNTSQYDATSSLDSNPPTNHHHHQPTSHNHLYTTTPNMLCASSSFDSSYASAGGADSSSLSMAGHCLNYSNSFDSAAVASATSTMSLNPNHLQTGTTSSPIASQWSASTSRLDSIKIASSANGTSPNGENKSAQKRRGKLVRDRTIDNADEHLSSHHHTNTGFSNKVNIMMGNTNGLRMSGEINRISSSSAKDSHEHQGVQQKDEGVSLNFVANQSRNGRISPPEKRVSLSQKMSISHLDVTGEAPQFDFSSLSSSNGNGEMHHLKKKPSLLSSSPHSLVNSRRTSYRSQHDSSSSHSKNSFSSSLSTTPPPACSTPSSSILPGINERSSNLGASGSSSLSSSPSPSSAQEASMNHAVANHEIYRDLQAKLSIRASTDSEEQPADAKLTQTNNLLSSIYSSLSRAAAVAAASGVNKPIRSNTDEASSGHLLNVANNNNNNNNAIFSSSFNSYRNQQLTVNSSNNITSSYSMSVKQPMCRSSSSPNYPTNPLHHHHGMNLPYNNPFPTIYSSPVTSNSSTYALDQQSQSSRFLGGTNSLTTSMSASPIYPTPFKSISCSIPITQPPAAHHSPFNNHLHQQQSMSAAQHQPPNASLNQFNPTTGFLGYNNQLAAAAAAAAATMPFFNPFNKQLPMQSSQPQSNNYHQHHAARMGEFNYRDSNSEANHPRPSILNNKPPEIVITESKSENSIAEYDQPNPAAAAAAAANFMNFVANFDQTMFRDGKPKNENDSVVNKYGPSLLLPSETKSPLNIFEDWSNLVNRNIKSPLIDGKQTSPGAASATSGSSSSTAAGAKAVKPHVCTSCQKRFARSDMLIRHSRLHSGVRPYRCTRCGQEFSRSDHLNTHLRTHTGEKPYSCPHPKCTYAACRKDMITRHLKVHNKTRISLSFDNATTSTTATANGLSMGMDAASATSYSFLPHSAAASFDATTTTTTSPIPFSTSCSNSNPSPASNEDYKRVSSDIKNEANNIS